MMANDTFVKDWIIHEEDNVDKIYKYLASIKNKYGMLATFLVSDKSHNYYTHNGFLEKVQKSKPQNQWYFKFKDKILIKNTNIVEYEKDGDKYILNTKYIEELDIYLLVEAKLDDFSQNTKQTFYRDASISLLLTLIIAILIFRVINNYNKRLEKSANNDYLTKIPNRRTFTKRLKFLLLLSKRKEHVFSLLFIDLDDFKDINDKFGHQVGDKILKECFNIKTKHTKDRYVCKMGWGRVCSNVCRYTS